MAKYLVLIDYINEICHPDGRLAAKWYAGELVRRSCVEKILEYVRVNPDLEICFVNLGFAPDYGDCPLSSPILGGASISQILERDTWSTQMIEWLSMIKGSTFHKTRVSATSSKEFMASLALRLNCEIVLAGVSTDLAISSTARALHDLDYRVSILESACASASEEDHVAAMRSLQKFGKIV